MEERVTRVFEELLSVASVGVNEEFLELGGHSLLAVQLMARLSDAFQCGLSGSALFGG